MTHCVEDEDRAELHQAVQGHVSEEAEGGDERAAALSVHEERKKKKSDSHPFLWLSIVSIRTHLMSSGTQLMSADLDVNGDATDASASDSDTPTSAALRAPQSLAPSPHIPTR